MLHKDVSVALASADSDEISMEDLKETYAPGKAKLKKLLTAPEEKLADSERRVQDIDYT